MSIRVYMRHARAARLDKAGVTCTSGIREWCTLHDVDLRAFAQDGLPIEQVDAIDDAFAKRAAAIAREETENGQE